jgi:hypothetical protein
MQTRECILLSYAITADLGTQRVDVYLEESDRADDSVRTHRVGIIGIPGTLQGLVTTLDALGYNVVNCDSRWPWQRYDSEASPYDDSHLDGSKAQ